MRVLRLNPPLFLLLRTSMALGLINSSCLNGHSIIKTGVIHLHIRVAARQVWVFKVVAIR